MKAGPFFPRSALPILALALGVSAAIHVEVVGTRFIPARHVKEFIPLDPEDVKDEDAVRNWKEDALFEISDLYRRSGFFDIAIDAEVAPGDGPGEWKARFKVTEGERYLFDTVRVVVVADSSAGSDTASVEAPGPSRVALPQDLDARPGKPYQEEIVFADRRTVLRKYGNAGFVRANVEDKITIKNATRTVGVDYLVSPSYAVVFDTLLIRDRRAPPADSLQGITGHGLFRSLVPYGRGDTVRVSQNDRVIEKLQYTGAFNFVRLRDSLLPGPGHRSALTLLSEEHVPGNFRVSLFYENMDGPGVSFDASHNNVGGTLNQVRSGFSVASERQRVYAGYGSPLTLGYLIRFDEDIDISWSQIFPPVPDSEGLFEGDWRATNSARLTWPWSYWLRLITNAELDGKSLLEASGRKRSMNLNFIQTAAVSFVNQPLDPSRGVRTSVSWGNGGPFLEDREVRLTENRHDWFEAQTGYYYYWPRVRQVKLAARLDGGVFLGAGGANAERFFLGGSRSVRSYQFHQLCPEKESSGVHCSLDNMEPAYFLTSAELRLGLFDFGYIDPRGKLKSLIPLQTVGFYDYGEVWNRIADPTPGTGPLGHSYGRGRGHAYGFGLRYPLLGIFNFRMDFSWGKRNDPPSSSDDWLGGWGRRRFGEAWPDTWIIDLAEAF
jgi:outer membrane protein assembly factor BamA